MPVYECDNCEMELTFGLTKCPQCGTAFDEPVPENAIFIEPTSATDNPISSSHPPVSVNKQTEIKFKETAASFDKSSPQTAPRLSFWARLNRPLEAEEIRDILSAFKRPLTVQSRNDDINRYQRTSYSRQTNYSRQTESVFIAPCVAGIAGVICLVAMLAFGQSNFVAWLQDTGLCPAIFITSFGLASTSFITSQLFRRYQSDESRALSMSKQATGTAVLAAFTAPQDLLSAYQRVLCGFFTIAALWGLFLTPELSPLTTTIVLGPSRMHWIQCGALVLVMITFTGVSAAIAFYEGTLIFESAERNIEIQISEYVVKTLFVCLILGSLAVLLIGGIEPADPLIVFSLIILFLAIARATFRVLQGERRAEDTHRTVAMTETPAVQICLFAGALAVISGLLWYAYDDHLFSLAAGASQYWLLFIFAGLGRVLLLSSGETRTPINVNAGFRTPLIRVRVPGHLELLPLRTALPLITGRWGKFLVSIVGVFAGIYNVCLAFDQTLLRRTFAGPVAEQSAAALEHSAGVQQGSLNNSIQHEAKLSQHEAKLRSILAVSCRTILTGAISWIALKDWLTSNVTHYPYAASFWTTFAIATAAIASITVRCVDRWRNVLLALATIICLFSQGHMRVSALLLSWGAMPATGILACALALPLPAPRLRADQTGLTHYLSRRFWHLLALAIAMMGLILQPNLLYFDAMAGLRMAVFTLGVAFIVCHSLQLTRRSVSARLLLLVFYGCCGLFYSIQLFNGVSSDNLHSAFNLHAALGEGLASKSPYGLMFVSEQGLISSVVVGFLILILLVRNFRSFLNYSDFNYSDFNYSESTHDSPLPEHSSWHQAHESIAANVSAGSFATLLSLIVFAPVSAGFLSSHSVVGTWVFALAIASLNISRLPSPMHSIITQPATRQASRGHRTGIVLGLAGVCVVAVLIYGGLLDAKARALAGTGAPAGTSAFTPLNLIPQAMQATASQNKLRTSWQNEHALLRYYFGSRANVTLPIASMLGMRLMGADRSSSFVRYMSAVVLGDLLDRHLPQSRKLELYLNGRDYGQPIRISGNEFSNLSVAAAYYFHASPYNLSPAEAMYLNAPQQKFGLKALRLPSNAAAACFQSSTTPAYLIQDFYDTAYAWLPAHEPRRFDKCTGGGYLLRIDSVRHALFFVAEKQIYGSRRSYAIARFEYSGQDQRCRTSCGLVFCP